MIQSNQVQAYMKFDPDDKITQEAKLETEASCEEICQSFLPSENNNSSNSNLCIPIQTFIKIS